MGTLNKDDDDGSENVSKKVNLRSFKLTTNQRCLGTPNLLIVRRQQEVQGVIPILLRFADIFLWHHLIPTYQSSQ